ncbi:hypothetical protein HDV05_006188 [Chytridiales sp. JEL 0842]|nr:hypothetical protein HDV05_006188 [Chytridiales sp. JEL 0842]
MDDSTLKILRVFTKNMEALDIIPPFSKAVKEYNLDVPSDVDGIAIQATPTEPDGFAQVQKAGPDGVVAISEGQSEVLIKVDAPDGSSSKITIKVFRPSASDATLKGFKVEPAGVVTPDFHRLELNYIIRLEPQVRKIKVTPLAMNSKALVAIDGNLIQEAEISLSMGATKAEFKVTSANGNESSIYTVVFLKDKQKARPNTLEGTSSICAMCLNIAFSPLKVVSKDGTSCNHIFCRTCLQILSKSSASGMSEKESSNGAIFACPFCPKEMAPKMDILLGLRTVMQDMEATYGNHNVKCPFSKFGCTDMMEISQLHEHVMSCTFHRTFESMCSECQRQDKSLGELEDGKHKITCTTVCQDCQKKVPMNYTNLHKSKLCLSKQELPASSALPTPSTWESLLVESKKPATIEACLTMAESKMVQHRDQFFKALKASAESQGACPILPATEALQDAVKMYAAAISINTEIKKTKGGTIDENLHILLGLALEEAAICKSLFPEPAKKDTKAEANDNTAACESFMSDEVEGLLLGLGVAKYASDAAKIKAMEEEYHRLLAAGQSDQAAEVQGLHAWKIKQVNASSGTAGWDSSSNASAGVSSDLTQAIEKYQHAIAVNPSSFDASFHLGRLLMQVGDFAGAQKYLKTAVAVKPVNPTAQLLLGSSIIKNMTLPADEETITSAIQLMEPTMSAYFLKPWSDFRQKQLGTFKEPPSENMTHQFARLTNPTFVQCFLDLSKAYAMNGQLKESMEVLLELLYRMPDEMLRIPFKGDAFAQMVNGFCEARNALYLLTVSAGEVKELVELRSVVEPTLLSAAFALTVSFGSRNENVTLEVVEKASQRAIYAKGSDPRALSEFGQVQLDQFDCHPVWTNNEAKLEGAIQSFRLAIESEMGYVDKVAEIVKGLKWFKELEEERNSVLSAAKARETKPKESAGETKKAGSKAPAKAASNAKKPADASPKTSSLTKGKADVDKKSSSAVAPKAQANTTKGTVQPKSKSGSKDSMAAPSSLINKTSATYNGKAGAALSKKPSAPAAVLKPGPSTKAKPAASSPAGSSTKLAKSVTGSTSSLSKTRPGSFRKVAPPPANAMYQPRIGLARAYARQLNILEEKKISAGVQQLIDEISRYYKEAITIKPEIHDAYIEYGSILERKVSISAAADLYGSFPFVDLELREATQDDLYLHTELCRAFMKEKRYKDPKLAKSLIAQGRAMGMPVLSKYVDILDAAGESKVLMEVYAGVNRKPVDHPDLQAFFKAKFWV